MNTIVSPAAALKNLNLNAEVNLEDSISLQAPLSDKILNPEGIFLTGATGFLGIHLLTALLAKTQAKIYCLVRGNDRSSALDRLQQQISFYQLPVPHQSDRIIPVLGDLSHSLFGLSPSEFQSLSEQIDVIYHNGSQVNSALDYAALKPANVLGTQEVLRLASQGSYSKVVHYVSSLAVFLSPDHAKVDRIYETDIPSVKLKGGYKQSKWVAEQLMIEAQNRGIPTSICRVGRIMGHSTTGINGNLSDFLCSLLKGCLRLGQYPLSDTPINLMPVDFVSEAFVTLTQQFTSKLSNGLTIKPSDATFHLLHPQPVPWNQLCQYLQALGYPLQGVPLDRWLTQLQGTIARDPNDELFAALLLLMNAPVNLLSPKAPIDASQALNALEKAGLSFPTIDRSLIDRYVTYFQKSGYFPLPSNISTTVSTTLSSDSPAEVTPDQSADPDLEAPPKTPTSFWKSIRTNRRSNQEAFTLKPIPRDGSIPLPLSFGQERLWQVEQLHQGKDGSAVHNLRAVFRLTGELNIPALHSSLQAIVDRHEVLRTRFPAVNGQPVQIIEPQVTIDLPLLDLTEHPSEDQESAVCAAALKAVQTPFDLATAPLIRYQLLRLSPNSHVLLRTVHHIVNDVWTDTIRLRELAQLYTAFSAGEPSPLPPLEIQYADFAYAQRQWLRGSVLEEQLNYWRKHFQGANFPLQLPTDYRLRTAPSYQGAATVVTLPESLSSQIKALAGQAGVSLFVALLAAFQTLLYCYTGQTDLTLCSPVAGRKQPETKKLIGYFSNIVLLRSQLDPRQGFKGVIQQASLSSLGASEQGDLPVQQVIEALNLPSGLLSRAMFTLQNVPKQPPQLSDSVKIKLAEMEEGTSNFDLSLSMKEKGNTLLAIFRYKTDLFAPETIVLMGKNLQTLLEILVENPDRPLEDLPQFDANLAENLASNLESCAVNRSVNYSASHLSGHSCNEANAPQGELEKTIAALWRSVLKIEGIDRTANFFELGGRSLAMAQVYSQLKHQLPLETAEKIQVSDLFEYPTIALMSEYIQAL